MDPGDGHRQRRRPRLFFSLWLLTLLLSQLSPPTILCINFSGESDVEAQAQLSASLHRRKLLPSTTPSELRQYHLVDSPWVRVPISISFVTQTLWHIRYPLFSVILHYHIFYFTEMTNLAQSGLDDQALSNISSRSDVPIEGTRGLCSSFLRHRYGTNLSSTRCITFIFKSVRLWLNLHDCDGVPASCVCFVSVPGVFHRHVYSILDRECHCHSAALFQGLIASSKHTPTVSYGKNLVNPWSPVMLLTSFSITGVSQFIFSPTSHTSSSCQVGRRTREKEVALIGKLGFRPSKLFFKKPHNPQDWNIIGLDLSSVLGLLFEPSWFLTTFKSRLGCYWASPLVSFVVFSFCKFVGQSPWLEDPCKHDPNMYEP